LEKQLVDVNNTFSVLKAKNQEIRKENKTIKDKLAKQILAKKASLKEHNPQPPISVPRIRRTTESRSLSPPLFTEEQQKQGLIIILLMFLFLSVWSII